MKATLLIFYSFVATAAVTIKSEEATRPLFLCPPGYHCESPSIGRENLKSISPKPCSVGMWSGAGQSRCSNCTTGHYTTKTGSSYCDKCTWHFDPSLLLYLLSLFSGPPGHYCADPTMQPTPCPLGSYNNLIAKTECLPRDPRGIWKSTSPPPRQVFLNRRASPPHRLSRLQIATAPPRLASPTTKHCTTFF